MEPWRFPGALPGSCCRRAGIRRAGTRRARGEPPTFSEPPPECSPCRPARAAGKRWPYEILWAALSAALIGGNAWRVSLAPARYCRRLATLHVARGGLECDSLALALAPLGRRARGLYSSVYAWLRAPNGNLCLSLRHPTDAAKRGPRPVVHCCRQPRQRRPQL